MVFTPTSVYGTGLFQVNNYSTQLEFHFMEYEAHHCIHKTLPVDLILSQFNPVNLHNQFL
jgi:hypothetical protein